MLRVTRHDENPGCLTFQVEGRLIGPWVEALRDCWQQALASENSRAIQIDLRGVTFVDAAGRTLLAEMSGHNAQLIASDCQMKALVAEIDDMKARRS